MGIGLKIRHLNKRLNGSAILQDIDLDIPSRELTAIIGRSGCGKSTLLRCIQGLTSFDGGEIEFEGHGTDQNFRRNFGLVFQSFNLFPHKTVLENLILAPVVVKKWTPLKAKSYALKMLEKVGLAKEQNRYPSELSGGQQQRAAIARALVLSPKVMLYDEPTSALDPWLVQEVFSVMKSLDEEGMTQIVVTHDMRFIRELATKIVFMEGGRVLETGTSEKLLTQAEDPKTRDYLRRLIG